MATIILKITLCFAVFCMTVSAKPLITVTFEQSNPNVTSDTLVLRKWHVEKGVHGVEFATLPKTWVSSGANKCAYDQKNGVIYIATHTLGDYNRFGAKITVVSTKSFGESVIKEIAPYPGCATHFTLNFDSTTGDLLQSCIGTYGNYLVSKVNVESGEWTLLRSYPRGDTTPFLHSATGYDEVNGFIANTYANLPLETSNVGFLPLNSDSVPIEAANSPSIFWPMWSGGNDGSMVSFGTITDSNGLVNFTSSIVIPDLSTNSLTASIRAVVGGDLDSFVNLVQAYDQREDKLYGCFTVKGETGTFVAGVDASTGKTLLEFKIPEPVARIPVCLIVQ